MPEDSMNTELDAHDNDASVSCAGASLNADDDSLIDPVDTNPEALCDTSVATTNTPPATFPDVLPHTAIAWYCSSIAVGAAAMYVFLASSGMLWQYLLLLLMLGITHFIQMFKQRNASTRHIWLTNHLSRGLLIIAVALLLGALLATGMNLTAMTVLGTAATGVGTFMVFFGLKRRTGDHAVCGQCFYQQDPSVEVCPECGTNWREQRLPLLQGDAAPRPRLIAVGATVLLLSFSPALLQLPRPPGSLLQMTPTRILISQAHQIRFLPPSPIWDEIAARELSESQSESAMRAYVNSLEGRIANFAGKRWASRALAHDELSDTARSILADAIFDYRLSLNEDPRFRGRFEVTLQPKHSLESQLSHVVNIVELTINNETVGMSRRTVTHFSARNAKSLAVVEAARLNPVEVRIVADALIIPASHFPARLSVDDKGHTILPDDTLLHRRVTLTRTVHNSAR